MKEIVCKNSRLDKNSDPTVADIGLVGDRAYLLWLYLEVTAFGRNPNSQNTPIIKKHLDFWTRYYNYR